MLLIMCSLEMETLFTYVYNMFVCRLFQHHKLFEVFLHGRRDDCTENLNVSSNIFHYTVITESI